MADRVKRREAAPALSKREEVDLGNGLRAEGGERADAPAIEFQLTAANVRGHQACGGCVVGGESSMPSSLIKLWTVSFSDTLATASDSKTLTSLVSSVSVVADGCTWPSGGRDPRGVVWL